MIEKGLGETYLSTGISEASCFASEGQFMDMSERSAGEMGDMW